MIIPRAAGGLEFLEKMVAGEAPQIPIGDLLGFRVVEAEKSRVVILPRS